MKRIQYKSITLRTVSICVLIVAPIVLLILLLARYSLNVPFWDQWEFAALLKKSTDGTLSFHDFWAQHNEHRVVFPRLIWYFWAKLTHWNTFFEVYTSVAIAVASFYLLKRLILKTFSNQKNLALATTVVVSWLFFSPIQWENWLWGWQVQWFLSIFGVILSVTFLNEVQAKKDPQLKTLAFAALGATIATYSLGNGAVAWGVGVLILWFIKAPIKKILIWLVTGIIVSGVHYIGYSSLSYPSKTLFLEQPKLFFHYIFVYIGRPLTFDIHQSVYVGILLLGLFGLILLYFWVNRKTIEIRKITPWLGLAIYGLFGSLLTAISRMGLGINSSFSSRYITVSVLFTLAVFILGIFMLTDVAKKQPKFLYPHFAQVIIICGIMIMTLVNYPFGIEQMRLQHLHLLKVRNCLETAKTVKDPCLKHPYPNSEILWPLLNYVKKENLSNFRD